MKTAPYDLADSRAWLAALSQGTGVIHTMGPQAAAENTSADRYEWKPLGFEDAEVNFVREDTEAAGNSGGFAMPFVVTMITADFDALTRLYRNLRSWVDILFGPPQGDSEGGGGYKFGKSGEPVRGAVPGAAAWSCKVPVALTDAVTRRRFPPREIVATDVQAFASDDTGADQAIPNLNG